VPVSLSALEAEQLRERIIVVSGMIDDETANVAIAKLLFLQSEEPHLPIQLWINSDGGYVSAALAIRDTIDAIR
jgi:ATP-dependent Clp protease, protease subunit